MHALDIEDKFPAAPATGSDDSTDHAPVSPTHAAVPSCTSHAIEHPLEIDISFITSVHTSPASAAPTIVSAASAPVTAIDDDAIAADSAAPTMATTIAASAAASSQSTSTFTPQKLPSKRQARKQAKRLAEKEKRAVVRQKEYDKALAKYRRRHKDKTEQECRDAVDKKMEKKRKRARRPVGSIMLMVFGALLLAFPIVSDLHASWLASQAITSYTSTIESMSAEEKDAMMAQALSYNHRLAGIATEEDIQAGQVPYDEILDTTGTGIMGSVTIDCIGVNQPIYHGTDESTLMSGVGHMEGTSFPMTSGGTHAAIAGHTGMPGQRMFDELVDLEPGDVVKVRLLDTETWYAVSSSEVVDPTMTATFVPEAGEDELTLITCTPYGINDHRLLVHCEAIPPQNQNQSDFGIANEDKLSKYINLRTIPIIVTVLLAICGILWRIAKKLRSRRKKCSLDKRPATEANQASTSSRGTPE